MAPSIRSKKVFTIDDDAAGRLGLAQRVGRNARVFTAVVYWTGYNLQRTDTERERSRISTVIGHLPVVFVPRDLRMRTLNEMSW